MFTCVGTTWKVDMVDIEGLARKYASALLNHYNWHTKESAWIERLRALAHFLREQRRHFVYAPRSLYFKVFQVFGFSEPDMKSLVILLEQQHRLLLLPDVLLSVIDLYKQEHGIEYCHISSAVPLTQAQEQKIKELLEQLSHKKLVCFYETDASLIAGIRARAETFVWEDSIEQRLRMLEHI